MPLVQFSADPLGEIGESEDENPSFRKVIGGPAASAVWQASPLGMTEVCGLRQAI
jgi:hypothetical protein